MTVLRGLEQRGDLGFRRLDVARDARRGGLGLLPCGRLLDLRRFIRLFEERVAGGLPGRFPARGLLFARLVAFTAVAPGTAAVVDAAARTVLVELERLDLDLALEQLLDVGEQARVRRRHERDRETRC